MNINDVKGEKPTKDKLEEIFEKQRSLMEKYEKIEERNGLLQTSDIPVNINDRKGQARLKDFFWRTTEEIMEAYEAYDKEDMEHFKEEIVDALHFFVEAMILSGIQFNQFVIPRRENDTLEVLFKEAFNYSFCTKDNIRVSMFKFIYYLGLAANTLKNKPWKQSHMMTDETKYLGYMRQALNHFIVLCHNAGFTADSLYNYYFRKNEVNKFRQRSGY